jgi:hypothetical protein
MLASAKQQAGSADDTTAKIIPPVLHHHPCCCAACCPQAHKLPWQMLVSAKQQAGSADDATADKLTKEYQTWLQSAAAADAKAEIEGLQVTVYSCICCLFIVSSSLLFGDWPEAAAWRNVRQLRQQPSCCITISVVL